MFYRFSQNNSFGTFFANHDVGISQFVYIEADGADQANDKANELGLYFDGVADGLDCPCCGDRWFAVRDDDGRETYPEVEVDWMEWIKDGPCGYVHKLDGSIDTIKYKSRR